MRSRLFGVAGSGRVALVAVLVVSLAGIAGSIDIQSAAADSPTGDAAIVQWAATQLKVPYCDGGGGINGKSLPTNSEPTCPDGPGFDCMSLAQYAVYQGTGKGVVVPVNGEMLPGGTAWNGQGTALGKDETALQPGDVVFFGGSDLWHYAHSGIYAGNDEVWDALKTGSPVGTHSMEALTSVYTNYQGGVRYSGSETPPAFAITSKSLPAATIGRRYGAQLTASGGTAPYRWRAKRLPRGLKVATKTGAISGIVKNSKHAPTAGHYSMVVTVTDGSKPKNTATATLVLTLNPAS